MGEEQGLSAELKPCPFCGGELTITKHFRDPLWRGLHRCKIVGAISFEWSGVPDTIAADWNTRSEGLHPPVGVEGEVFSSLGASRAPSCVSAGVAETPSDGCAELQRKLKRTEHARDLSRRYWAEAAAKALRALPGASNSMHPAYDLWLRVEMNGLPPESLVLSDDGSPTDCQTSGGEA